MALFYGALRSIAAALRALASRKHAKAKKIYEGLANKFNELETDCKSEEVCVGRPVGLTAQIRLLKAYEAKDQARAQWIRATNKLQSRKRWEDRIVAFSGRKIPYTLGLIDMAVIMQALDYLGLSVDIPTIVGMVRTML